MPPSRSRSRRTFAAERARAQAVLGRLQDAVTALVVAAEASLGERCPYRDASDRCTFTGGCQNQRREAGRAPDVECGGDHLLKWTGP